MIRFARAVLKDQSGSNLILRYENYKKIKKSMFIYYFKL